MKKIIAVAIAFVMCFSLLAPVVSAADYNQPRPKSVSGYIAELLSFIFPSENKYYPSSNDIKELIDENVGGTATITIEAEDKNKAAAEGKSNFNLSAGALEYAVRNQTTLVINVEGKDGVVITYTITPEQAKKLNKTLSLPTFVETEEKEVDGKYEVKFVLKGSLNYGGIFKKNGAITVTIPVSASVVEAGKTAAKLVTQFGSRVIRRSPVPNANITFGDTTVSFNVTGAATYVLIAG